MATTVRSESGEAAKALVEALLNETRREFGKAHEYCWLVAEETPDDMVACALRNYSHDPRIAHADTPVQLTAWLAEYDAKVCA